ncbi:MAG: chromate transporter [Spirochaetaceae bacterium]|jgi:chromate transporter|nr:chromate transporter [Spirochaetaceae bacterium]
MKAYLELIIVFLKMGCTTFGGGYAMLPVIERELVKKRGWVAMEEVMDYYTIAQITPGVIAVNVSTFVGYKQRGPLGGLIATLCFVLPGVALITTIAIFMQNFAEYPVVQHAFTGIRVAVGALVLDTVRKLVKGVFKDIKATVIFLAAFALSVIASASPVLLVTAAGVAGFFLYRPTKKDISGGKQPATEEKPVDAGGTEEAGISLHGEDQ